MLFECRCCSKLYSAEAEHEDRLCLYCREKQGRIENEADYQDDWREPLYECARNISRYYRCSDCDRLMRMLILLGEYRNCPEMLEKSRLWYQRMMEQLTDVVKSPNSGLFRLESAAKDLKDLSAWFDTKALVIHAEERILEIKESEECARAQRIAQEARRKRITGIIAALVSGTAILCALMFSLFVLPDRLRRADACMEEGSFSEAFELYESSVFLWYASQAEKGMAKAQRGMADDYMAEGLYEEAIRLYSKAEEPDRIEEAYLLWSDQLAAQGDAASALEQLKHAGNEDEYWERYERLYMQYAAETADAVIARGAEANVEFAREKGLQIDTLNAQLHYCHRLANVGYDLGAVYPEGVTIRDASLGKYQFDAIAKDGKLPDMSRVLFFERVEITYTMDSSTDIITGLTGRNRTNDFYYKVKLLPGQMFGKTHFSPAQSLEDATAVILIDGIYRKGGEFYLNERVGPVQYKNIHMPAAFLRRSYAWYKAVNNIAVYDKANPAIGRIGCLEEYEPAYADEDWYEQHKNEDEELKKFVNRHGVFDMQSLYDQLDEVLAKMAM